MKRLNGLPMVHFVNVVLDFDIPLAEAEQVLAIQSIAGRREAVEQLLRQHQSEISSVSEYTVGEFVKCLGVALAEQRGKELRQLSSGANSLECVPNE